MNKTKQNREKQKQEKERKETARIIINYHIIKQIYFLIKNKREAIAEMVSCFAPGKLLLIGEWSVLEDGNPAIVLALSNGITVDVVASPKNGAPSFTFDLLDMKMRFSTIPPLCIVFSLPFLFFYLLIFFSLFSFFFFFLFSFNLFDYKL